MNKMLNLKPPESRPLEDAVTDYVTKHLIPDERW